MTHLFLVLALISGAVSLGGYVWHVVTDSRARRDLTAYAEEPSNGITPVSDGTAYTEGTGTPQHAMDRTVMHFGLSLAEAGQRVRMEGWRPALPILLALGGMLALLVTAALVLLASLPSKLFGIAASCVAVYILISELRSFQKALRSP